MTHNATVHNLPLELDKKYFNSFMLFYEYYTIYTRSNVAAVVGARDAEYLVGDRFSVVALCVQCGVHP